MKRLIWPALLALAACGDPEILHGLDEAQANQALVALDEIDIRGDKRREDGPEGGWTLTVPAADAARAQRALAEREIPRSRPQGFGEVFGKASMVPTPVEERALYLHALAGELSRSIESIDGVVEARVHLALPPEDPLRPEEKRPPRAGVLVKCRPSARSQIESLREGIQALVAGAADGLEPRAVSVVVAESGGGPALQPRAGRPRERLLATFASGSGVLAIGFAALAVVTRRRAVRTA